MKLNDKKIRDLKPESKAYRKFDGDGLYIEVMPGGAKYWRLKYRYLGKEKKLSFGVYPEVSLAEAREKRSEARKLIRENIDPSLAKKEEKRLAKHSADNTFEVLAREWHEHSKEKWNPIYRDNILHRLEMDIFPEIGYRPVKDITPPQVLDAMRKIEKRGAHEMARRALQTTGQIFRYAVATGRAESDPARDLKGALKPFKRGHFAALDSKELPEFLAVLNKNDARLFPQTIRAVKLLMLTFVRTSELIGARWEEFDFEAGLWEIPAERMKMKKAHIVPLSRQTKTLFLEQKEITGQWEWVFPNQVRPKKPMTNNTVLMALRRMGYQGKMTGHGFRALAMSTIKEKLGYRHEVVDRQLAHVPGNQVDKAYDRAQFLDDRTKMMQDWSDYLDAVATEGQVISLAEKRKGA
jgi:integrase